MSSHGIRFIGLGEGNDKGPIQMDIYCLDMLYTHGRSE